MGVQGCAVNSMLTAAAEIGKNYCSNVGGCWGVVFLLCCCVRWPRDRSGSRTWTWTGHWMGTWRKHPQTLRNYWVQGTGSWHVFVKQPPELWNIRNTVPLVALLVWKPRVICLIPSTMLQKSFAWTGIGEDPVSGHEPGGRLLLNYDVSQAHCKTDFGGVLIWLRKNSSGVLIDPVLGIYYYDVFRAVG